MEARDELTGAVLAALDRADVGMAIAVERDGSFERVHVSRAAARLFGYERAADLAPVRNRDLVPPSAHARLLEIHATLREPQGAPKRFRIDILRRDGVVIPIEADIAQTTFCGEPAVVVFLRDVSDRVEVEERLRVSENRFRTLAEAAPDAIAVVRRDIIRYANPAARRLLGAPAGADVVGSSLRNLIVEEDLMMMEERMTQALRGVGLRPYEYRVRYEDGTMATVEISSMPIEYEGEPCLLAFGRDVTERKRMQSRLIHADRLATVGTLATGVAHEINNPLTYVVLHLEKLRITLPRTMPEESARDEAVRLLSEALEGAERVRLIVQDLLSLARSDTSAHAPTDVRRVVETSVKLAGPVLDDRARLETSLEPTTLVRANAAWLGQVFVNLLVNAGQAFVVADPARNFVRVSTLTRESGEVVVEVEDNGPGIDEDIADRIFDPFFTTKPVGSGTGLGLAISRSVVDSVGGEIEVISRRGEGTLFRVVLPPADRAPMRAREVVDATDVIRAALEEAARRSSLPPADD